MRFELGAPIDTERLSTSIANEGDVLSLAAVRRDTGEADTR